MGHRRGKLTVLHNYICRPGHGQGAPRQVTHPLAIWQHQNSIPIPQPGGSSQKTGTHDAVSAVQHPVPMGICSIVWHDPYRSIHPRMTSARPREWSGGIVRGIEGRHTGEHGFICVGLQCGIVEREPRGLQLPDGRIEGEYSVLTVT